MEDKLLFCAVRETERLDENSRKPSGNQESSREIRTTKAAEKPATKKAAEKPTPTPVSKMTKTQIVKALAEKLATEPKQVQAFFDGLAEMATEQTREAGEFTIPGLGKVVKAERKERMGRNPQTGEEMKIAAKTAVKFRIAKAATDVIAPPKA